MRQESLITRKQEEMICTRDPLLQKESSRVMQQLSKNMQADDEDEADERKHNWERKPHEMERKDQLFLQQLSERTSKPGKLIHCASTYKARPVIDLDYVHLKGIRVLQTLARVHVIHKFLMRPSLLTPCLDLLILVMVLFLLLSLSL